MGHECMEGKWSNGLLLLIFLVIPVGMCAMEQEEEIRIDGMNLIEASKSGQKDIVVSLVEKEAKIEAVDSYGWTALMKAAMYGHTEIVKYLIEKGANIEAVSNIGAWTALMAAAMNGHTEIVKYLIKKGAKIEAVDNYGNTALMWTIEWKEKDTISQLLENGTNPYIKNKEKKNSLDLAGDNQALKNHIIKKHREYKKKCVEHLVAFLQKGDAKNGIYCEWDENKQNENGLQKNKKCGPFPKDIALYIARIRYGVSEDEWQQMCRDGNG